MISDPEVLHHEKAYCVFFYIHLMYTHSVSYEDIEVHSLHFALGFGGNGTTGG
jgi:hypothetical protein